MKVIKKYKIIDNQNWDFMCDTHDNPMTLEGIRKRFWSLDECRSKKYINFTKEYIEDMWEVDIVEVEDEEEKTLEVRIGNTFYKVIEETKDKVCIIQTFNYADGFKRQHRIWKDKSECDVRGLKNKRETL